MAKFKKDPNAILDYTFDWTAYLAPLGVNISSVAFLLSSGLTEVSHSNTTTTATIFVSGGTAGTDETVTCRITTGAGPTARVDDRTITLNIVDR